MTTHLLKFSTMTEREAFISLTKLHPHLVAILGVAVKKLYLQGMTLYPFSRAWK